MFSLLLSPFSSTTTPDHNNSTPPITEHASTPTIEFSFDYFQHVQLPTELWLYILQYLQIPDLGAFSKCDSKLFHWIMCRNVKRENSFTFTIKNWFSNTIETSKEQVEYQPMQQLVWGPMLLRYFPRFQISSLEGRVRNYLTVLQRRMRFVKQQDDEMPSIRRQLQYSSLDLFRLEQERQHKEMKMKIQQGLTTNQDENNYPNGAKVDHVFDIEDLYDFPLIKKSKRGYLHYLEDDFIENCQWVYKCPLNFTQIADHSKNSTICSHCNERVYRVRTEQAFKYHSDMGHCVAFTYKGEKKIGCVLY
ncbi:hypothetical protein C9374_007525 [Naegleria lovaniensis]|uniref:F-box domain-containing protein n=1 Tax=Naegleria lovaniensis TaxID=51637 RepID=A0AA88GN19_NAELO|nr:uncharacterized protein C9374_007525 [Naegleria lovaniensis]KAG2379386.1 hypothetical protein C9374_007525 [Naegleria lovaniensis]